MRCFIVGEEGDGRRTALIATAERLLGFEPDTIADLESLRRDPRFLRAPRALVLLPEKDREKLDTAAAVAFAGDFATRAFVVCIAETIAPEDLRRLVRTGAADWLTWLGYAEDLGALVRRLSTAGLADRPTAKIISFLPSKGGVGTTTLAIETATLLAKGIGADGRVAILDLNLQGGTVAEMLDVEPRFDIAEIMHRPERLDEQLVDIFASRSEGIDVFAGPFSRIALHAVQPETIFTLIDTIAVRYDAVLFDLPGVSLAWSDNLLRGSDVVVVCGGDTIPALRRLSATLGHVEAIGVGKTKLAAVVNATEADLLGRLARRKVIERALGTHRTFTVRRDLAKFTEVLDLGRPLHELMPGSRVARDIRRLADWVREAAIIRRAGAEPLARQGQGL